MGARSSSVAPGSQRDAPLAVRDPVLNEGNHASSPTDWETVEEECRIVRRRWGCHSLYSCLYAEAAASLGWEVKVMSKAENTVFVKPASQPGILLEKHRNLHLCHTASSASVPHGENANVKVGMDAWN